MIYGGRDSMVRHYVEVVAMHHRDNQVTPIQIAWDDGRLFDVRVVGHITRERCQTHGYALRYNIMIGKNKRILWRDEQGWFVEVPEYAESHWHLTGRPMPLDPRFSDIPC